MKTLLLDQSAWDLVLDASGNIALAADPYSLAQDAASACRTFLGEPYYDTSQGVPYFQQILGELPPAALMKALLVKAALTVPGVLTAKVVLKALADRQLAGQVQITDAAGNTLGAGLPIIAGPTPGPPTPPPSGGSDLDFSNPDNSIWTTV